MKKATGDEGRWQVTNVMKRYFECFILSIIFLAVPQRPIYGKAANVHEA